MSNDSGYVGEFEDFDNYCEDDSYDPYDEDDADGDVCPGCGLYFDECECEDY